ncbi:MAG: ATP-binding cassette domain-containing protein, partial [Marmoricola sp.]
MSTALAVTGGGLELGGRPIWSDLTFEVSSGELVAVLGANGAGKSSLLKVLLGLLPLGTGQAHVLGQAPRRGRREVGYLPQHRTFAVDAPLRARDLVELGLNGHRYGLRRSSGTKDRVEEHHAAVG